MMKELFLDSLSIAYALAGILCCFAYCPTIADLYCRKKASANVSTYVLWTSTASITLLYSIFVLPDMLFIVISGMNLAACSIVLLLAYRLKKSEYEVINPN